MSDQNVKQRRLDVLRFLSDPSRVHLAPDVDVSDLVKRYMRPEFWHVPKMPPPPPSTASKISEVLERVECREQCEKPYYGGTYGQNDPPHYHDRPYQDGARVYCPLCKDIIKLSAWWDHGCAYKNPAFNTEDSVEEPEPKRRARRKAPTWMCKTCRMERLIGLSGVPSRCPKCGSDADERHGPHAVAEASVVSPPRSDETEEAKPVAEAVVAPATEPGVEPVVESTTAPETKTVKRIDELDELEEKYENAQARIAAIVAGGERVLKFPDINPDCGFYVVHRNTYPDREGGWRVTRFLSDETPTGHTEAQTFAQAIEEARMQGADVFVMPESYNPVKTNGKVATTRKGTLTPTQASQIRRRALNGEKGKVLAAEFGVSLGYIYVLKKGRGRTHWDEAQL